MAVSIVIVSYNTRDATLECISSVLESPPNDATIVVVDNGSTDDSAAAIRERYPSVVVDEARANLGFAAGVNRGVRRTAGEYVLLLNPDTVVRPGSLASLMAFAENNPHYGLYGGRTVHRDGSLEPSSCWGAPSLWSLTCFALGLSTIFKRSRLFDPESLGSWARDTVREVPIITGCLLLMRRAHWDALGGMDETYFLYGEDADFSIRATRQGHCPVIVPQAVVIHDVGGSSAWHGAKMSMVMAGKTTLLKRSWTPGRARIGIALIAAGTLLRATAERALGRRGTWWTVWRRRRDWSEGYPRARSTLFGLPVEQGRGGGA
ncbi:glycosyltransferase family 2 protein [uncultured Friedmanniella sp.]|uniref:glycosyltransferase family 2 protein n=1 Tax=uncultured Friedmanniella sp. TaxID=335381 RepID=UPI0035C9B7D9